MNQLGVYFDTTLVGSLIQEDNAALHFQYAEGYLNSDVPRAISLSLPLSEALYTGKEVKAYFSGLLPDEQARIRLGRYLGISDKNRSVKPTQIYL